MEGCGGRRSFTWEGMWGVKVFHVGGVLGAKVIPVGGMWGWQYFIHVGEMWGARWQTSLTWKGRTIVWQCRRASASDNRMRASSWRTVMRYDVLLPGTASSVRSRLYASTSFTLACAKSPHYANLRRSLASLPRATPTCAGTHAPHMGRKRAKGEHGMRKNKG